jgi:3-oxoacyl-[acyl-carrier protein] reductase
MRLKDKVSIVTGGGQGIGKATALEFAKEGAKLVLCDVMEDAVNAVCQEIRDMGGEAIAVTTDVTKSADVDNVVKQALDKFGRIDCLINNAGITADSTLLKMTEDQWDKVIAVNLKGVYLFGQAVAKVMAEQEGGGCIISASSVVGLYGNFGQTNYAATKWGVIGMTKTWAKELGKKGVRANAVAPGFIATDMVKKMPEKVLDKLTAMSPLKRIGQPIDVANVYKFLASDEASFITGAVISVDGGVVL